MAFIDDEQSLIGSSPTELYLFALGITYWRQNSGTEEISWGGKTWYPKLIRRSTKSLTTNALRSQMEIETSLSNEFAQQYITASPDGMVNFILYRGQSGDYVPYWRGYVEKVTFNPELAVITCTPLSSRLRRSGLHRKFSRGCNLAVYSTRCALSPAAYQVAGTVDSVSGLMITSTAFGTKADGYFIGGYIETEDYVRMIVNHVGNDVYLNTPIPSLAAGESFLAFRGCDHTLTTCASLNNNLNYGGHPWLPDKNPFQGDGIA